MAAILALNGLAGWAMLQLPALREALNEAAPIFVSLIAPEAPPKPPPTAAPGPAAAFDSPRVKLPAGDMLLYPGTSVHRVEPVTRGQRIASFFWVESMVRSDEQRRLLFDLDAHLMRLRSEHGEADAAAIGITGTSHNLLRMWANA